MVQSTDQPTRQAWRDWVLKKVEFYINSGQWDNVTIPEFRSWLGNFDDNGKIFVASILDKFIYYPEYQVKLLCRQALNKTLFYEHLLRIEWETQFEATSEFFQKAFSDFLRKCRIVPVLDKGNPSESGNIISRHYTLTGVVSDQHVIRPDQVPELLTRGAVDQIVLVDDFIGSGDQVIEFWNSPRDYIKPIETGTSFADLAHAHSNVRFTYIALVATTFGLNRARPKVPGLSVLSCEELSDEYRVFHDQSIYLPDDLDRSACENYLIKVCGTNNLSLLGYNDLDFAIAFHHGAPDVTLPIFWETAPGWKPLFNRRM